MKIQIRGNSKMRKVLLGAGIAVVLVLALRGALAQSPQPAQQKDPAELGAQVDVIFQDYMQMYGALVGVRAKNAVQEKRIAAMESRIKELEEKCGDTCRQVTPPNK